MLMHCDVYRNIISHSPPPLQQTHTHTHTHTHTQTHAYTPCEMRETCLLQPRRAPAGAVWDARGCCATLGRRTCAEWQCRWPSATAATWTSPSRPTHTHKHTPTHTHTHTHTNLHVQFRGQSHQNNLPAAVSSVKISPCNLTFSLFKPFYFPQHGYTHPC